ncbi:hypothetical protein TI05_18830 [Achromatium sp. WMS3]|nr:hypothetical protein TI05_18830 [Achromatium sp. WMS3]
MVHKEFFQVPIITFLAKTQGTIVGLLLIYLKFDQQYFDLEQMFTIDGPWDLTLTQFFLERANMFTYNIFSVIHLLTQMQTDAGWIAGFAIILLPLILLFINLMLWQHQDALRALLASAIIALWTTWVVVYIVATIFWIVHLLNVWTLILLLIYIKYTSDSRDTESWWPW